MDCRVSRRPRSCTLYGARRVVIESRFMKITAIARSHTGDSQIAFKTDPPLTKEVLDCAIANFFGPAYSDTFVEGGLFIVHRALIPEGQVPEYERALTGAEKQIQQTKQKADNVREAHLRQCIQNAKDEYQLCVEECTS
jgi:hypothetical protein